mmetsp:Transcript_6639/g.23425  ORF Transcript_6639/g.23425 Transcript_6639/m.23425 type:complete len:173 (+) Transcript_6639:611-1129(+)
MKPRNRLHRKRKATVINTENRLAWRECKKPRQRRDRRESWLSLGRNKALAGQRHMPSTCTLCCFEIDRGPLLLWYWKWIKTHASTPCCVASFTIEFSNHARLTMRKVWFHGRTTWQQFLPHASGIMYHKPSQIRDQKAVLVLRRPMRKVSLAVDCGHVLLRLHIVMLLLMDP